MSRADVELVLDGPGHRATERTGRRVAQREYKLCGRDWHKGRLYVRYSRTTQRLTMALWLEVTHGTLG